MKFKLSAPYKPAGGQPEAIKQLINNLGTRQVLHGITGSGKTFVLANVIKEQNKPVLVLAHNKTLAAQLYQELKQFFPENRVEYFISYYDYYQPESYLPTSDTYIEKDATVNDEIDKMRLRATASLLSRDDVIIVASISCIYGIGDPKEYKQLSLKFKQGQELDRDDIIHRLVEMQYTRSDMLEPGRFRFKGETLEVWPAYDNEIVRIDFFGDEIESVTTRDKVTGAQISELETLRVYPAKHFVVGEDKIEKAMQDIRNELDKWAPQLSELERQRVTQRVTYDLEMISELGYCNGIENYSRHFDGRKKGTPPFTLLDFFPENFLFIIDESHQTIPQSHAMYKGDLARKKNLVDFGFRLPSAYDNRPLKFPEFEQYLNNTIFVSATPANYEIECSTQVVEQIIRPTGLLDPLIEVRATQGHVTDVLNEIKKCPDKILITTLTKRMAEDLTDYLAKEGVEVRYMHSDIDSLDRIELIRSLRAGEFKVLVGINLLREGLDIPEVSLVCILDADKQGFLRNERSLIQTIGRAARNENGRVIMYGNEVTDSMQQAIDVTRARRKKQVEYNKKHNVVPRTIIKKVEHKKREIKGVKHLGKSDLKRKINEVELEMKIASDALDFEKAIELRDVLAQLKFALKEQ